MSETFKKVDGNTIGITSQTEAICNKTYEELEADLTQAQDSLEQVKLQHVKQIAEIQATIDIMQARLDEAKLLVITAKAI